MAGVHESEKTINSWPVYTLASINAEKTYSMENIIQCSFFEHTNDKSKYDVKNAMTRWNNIPRFAWIQRSLKIYMKGKVSG